MSISRFLAFLWFLAQVAAQASLGGFWGIVHEPSPTASSGSIHCQVNYKFIIELSSSECRTIGLFFLRQHSCEAAREGLNLCPRRKATNVPTLPTVPLAMKHSVATPLKPMTCVNPLAPRSLWKSAFVKSKSKTVLTLIAVRSPKHLYADLLSGLSDCF